MLPVLAGDGERQLTEVVPVAGFEQDEFVVAEILKTNKNSFRRLPTGERLLYFRQTVGERLRN